MSSVCIVTGGSGSPSLPREVAVLRGAGTGPPHPHSPGPHGSIGLVTRLGPGYLAGIPQLPTPTLQKAWSESHPRRLPLRADTDPSTDPVSASHCSLSLFTYVLIYLFPARPPEDLQQLTEIQHNTRGSGEGGGRNPGMQSRQAGVQVPLLSGCKGEVSTML